MTNSTAVPVETPMRHLTASSPLDAEGSRVTPANIDSLPETGGRA